MSDIQSISTGDAPTPAGHYAQATMVNGLIFISGQLPVEVGKGARPDLRFEDQVRLAMANALAVMAAAGGGVDRVVRVTAYIVGVENWPLFNAVYADIMGDIKPARTVVPVAELHHGCLVEVDMIGAVPG